MGQQVADAGEEEPNHDAAYNLDYPFGEGPCAALKRSGIGQELGKPLADLMICDSGNVGN